MVQIGVRINATTALRMLRMLANAYKWACKRYNVLMNDANVYYQRCYSLAICLRMMRIFDDEAATVINKE